MYVTQWWYGSEIILRSKQVCNLSEVVVRSEDTFEDLKRKVKFATILGTAQATQTNFKYLSPVWKKNTEEEALLGVSLTGIMDHPVMSGNGIIYDELNEEYYNPLEGWLQELRDYSVEVNKEWAAKFKINPAAAITCVKPSGTVSQLVDSASGIHPRYSPYYVRTVRADKKDPLAQMMVDQRFPFEVDLMKPDNGLIFSFPIKAPDGSVYRDDRTAIEQLELWKTYQLYWSEHKPSITVYVKPDEWMEVGAWVYREFDIMSGVSFLPHSDHTYKQAPYQEIDEDEYNEWLEKMPKDVDWSLVSNYEEDDNTSGSQTMACTGGVCEIVDIS